MNSDDLVKQIEELEKRWDAAQMLHDIETVIQYDMRELLFGTVKAELEKRAGGEVGGCPWKLPVKAKEQSDKRWCVFCESGQSIVRDTTKNKAEWLAAIINRTGQLSPSNEIRISRHENLKPEVITNVTVNYEADQTTRDVPTPTIDEIWPIAKACADNIRGYYTIYSQEERAAHGLDHEVVMIKKAIDEALRRVAGVEEGK